MNIIDFWLLCQGIFTIGWAFAIYPLFEERPFQGLGVMIAGNAVFAVLLAIAWNTQRAGRGRRG